MLRTIVGVIIGYLIFGVSAVLIFRLTGHDPHERASTAFMVGTIVAGIVAALIGGYVAVLIARSKHAATALAVIITLIAVISSAYAKGSLWSNLAAAVLMGPAAKIGGGLARRRT